MEPLESETGALICDAGTASGGLTHSATVQVTRIPDLNSVPRVFAAHTDRTAGVQLRQSREWIFPETIGFEWFLYNWGWLRLPQHALDGHVTEMPFLPIKVGADNTDSDLAQCARLEHKGSPMESAPEFKALHTQCFCLSLIRITDVNCIISVCLTRGQEHDKLLPSHSPFLHMV